jgi:hypothetical protein
MRNRLLVATLLAALGCGEEPGSLSPGGGTGHGNPGRTWTFLVYMVADNNLEPFALADMAEMAQAGSSDQVKVVVQIDRAAGYSSDPLGNIADFTTAKRILVEKGSYTELADLGELDMGDQNTLENFVEWGLKAYPADRTALIFWDHGGSWPGFGGDESANNSVLDLAELKGGLQAAMTAANQKQFALIGFDACLMGTVEVALAMKPFGEYLLASEELEPGHGWDYRNLSLVMDDPGTAPDVLGRKLVDGFTAQAKEFGTSANITLALTDLYALDDVVAGLDALNRDFTAKMSEFSTTLGRQREASLAFGQMPDPRQSFNMVDLGDLLTHLASADARFAAVRTQIQGGLAKAVLAKTTGSVTAKATGLSVYFPASASTYAASYDKVTESSSWRTFLKAFIGGGSAAGTPLFTNPNKLAGATLSASSLALTGTLAAGAAASISSATLTYGLRDAASSTVILLGEQPAEWNPTTAGGTWDLSILSLSQGTTEGYGYLQLGVTGSGEVEAAIAFGYKATAGAEAQYCIRRMVFDASEKLVQDSYYLVVNGQAGELTPAAGSELYPLVQQVDAAGTTTWEYGGSTPFNPKQPINLGFKAFQAGSGAEVFAAVAVANYAGEGDAVFTVKKL